MDHTFEKHLDERVEELIDLIYDAQDKNMITFLKGVYGYAKAMYKTSEGDLNG